MTHNFKKENETVPPTLTERMKKSYDIRGKSGHKCSEDKKPVIPQWSISEEDEDEDQYRKSEGAIDINITVSDYTSVCPVVSGLLDDDDKNSDAATANVRAHLEDLQELVAELEQTLLETYGGQTAESLWQLTAAMADKLDWCGDGVGEMHSSLSERSSEVARLGEMVRGKEEQIRRLERERGELLEKVRRLQSEVEALAGLVGAGAGQDGARLAECLREKCEAVENLQEEVRRNRKRSIIDDRDELLEKTLRLEQRLQRLQSRGQDSDLEEYVKTLEQKLEEAELHRERFSKEIEGVRRNSLRQALYEKERMLSWLRSRAVSAGNDSLQEELIREVQSLRGPHGMGHRQSSSDTEPIDRALPPPAITVTEECLLNRQDSHTTSSSSDEEEDSDVLSSSSNSSGQSVSPNCEWRELQFSHTLFKTDDDW